MLLLINWSNKQIDQMIVIEISNLIMTSQYLGRHLYYAYCFKNYKTDKQHNFQEIILNTPIKITAL